ncbi:unnamed protein product [Phyllotreta striolata]|uniref:Uncharacterized protein n=1 Tax=Phyllotreta striolata TaxID=444603 RepID=A0A9N9XJT1_PHYSR|nr:unnamed protein product [Phyllotreta striolata]
MSCFLMWFLLLFITLSAQDPRRSQFHQGHDIRLFRKGDGDNVSGECEGDNCVLKRFVVEDVGPFWANRGKRDPTYMSEALYAEEPYCLLIRGENYQPDDPFFISRGKKEVGNVLETQLRDTRDVLADDAPFFAARGKKYRIRH